jgi:arsenate reductase
MSKVMVYGIPNCDSVKKALQWFEEHRITVAFYNYKKTPATEELLLSWCKQVDWKILFNTKGSTWKKMAPAYEGKNITQKQAVKIMLENNSIIKRPVVEFKQKLLVGFDETLLETTFSKK